MQYLIDNSTFTNKTALLNHVISIRDQYEDHELLVHDHLRFMVAFLHHHPDSDEKIGCGVADMWVAPDPVYGTRGFWLRRTDGTETDFGMKRCVSPRSPLRDVKSACRRAIGPDVVAFRNIAFVANDVYCPILGIPLTENTCHVDHQPPNTFDAIVEEFIRVHAVDVESVALVQGDGVIGNVLADQDLTRQWIDFHNARASLRIVSVRANLSDIRRDQPV